MTTELITAERYVFVPDQGERESFLAETEREAQLYAADVYHDRPGALFHTGEMYPAERFADGFVRALTEGRYTLADDIARAER